MIEGYLWAWSDSCIDMRIEIVYRKSICSVRRWVACDKSTRIPVSMVHCSLRISGNDVSMDEAECFVGNMIYKGYMRVYISHEKQMVMLARTNAFPRLGDRQSPYALL